MGCGSSSDAAAAAGDNRQAGANPASPRFSREDRPPVPPRIGTDNPVPDPNRRKGYLTQQVDSLEDYRALLRSNGIDDVDDPAAGHPVAPERIVVISRSSSVVSRSSLRSSSRRVTGGSSPSASPSGSMRSGARSRLPRVCDASSSSCRRGGSTSQYAPIDDAARTPAEELMIQQLVSESMSLNTGGASGSTSGLAGQQRQSTMSYSDLVPVTAEGEAPPGHEAPLSGVVGPTWSPPAASLNEHKILAHPNAVPDAAGAAPIPGATPYIDSVTQGGTSPSSNSPGTTDDDDEEQRPSASARPLATSDTHDTAASAAASISMGDRRKSVIFSDRVSFVEPSPVKSKFPQYY